MPCATNVRRLTVQTVLTVQPQRLIQNEREYLVAPCSMIVQGVLNGGYVDGDEIRACRWDGIPVVVGHPMSPAGVKISAQSPDVPHVGRVFRTQYLVSNIAGRALVRAQAELWLDTAQVAALGGEALQAMTMLETQTPLEVSTAFYSNAEAARGSFYGAPYQEIHHDLLADHLALLPNSIGACNWQDGCGAPRLNEQGCACGGACETCQAEESMDMPSPTRLEALWTMLRTFFQPEGAPVANLLSMARTPTYTGTENTPWSAPTFQTYTHALFSGATMPASVADCTEAQKRTIAAHTLLGDPTASTFAGLSFFPCVNPRTGKLNERALRAVISGRGSQATIPAAALASAQQKARALLKSEFDAQLETHQTDVDIREALYGELAREMGMDCTPIFLDSVDATTQTFTYRQGERLVQRSWSVGPDGLIELGSDQQDIQRQTSYVPVPGTADTEGDQPSMAMNTEVIKRRVDALIANAQTGWTDSDRHFLESQDEAFLIRLEHQPKQIVGSARQPETVSEAIATLPAHLQEPLQAMADEYEARKNAAIKVIMANKANPFSEPELQAMTAQRLEKIVAMAGDEVPLRPGQAVVKEVRLRDYSLQGLPHVREEDMPPAPPKTLELSAALRAQRAS